MYGFTDNDPDGKSWDIFEKPLWWFSDSTCTLLEKWIWVWLLFSSWTRAIRENTTIVYRPFATKRESLKIRINNMASLIYKEKRFLILWYVYNVVNKFVINKTNQSPPSVKHLFEVHLFKTCRLRGVYQIWNFISLVLLYSRQSQEPSVPRMLK